MQPIIDIPAKTLAPGITGHYAHGEQMTFGYVVLEEGSKVPLHQHMQEQITYIMEGELEMQIGEQTCVLQAGMYHVIPSQTWHSAVARTACKVIDAFSPVREDYKIPSIS